MEGRRWIGVDSQEKAKELVIARLRQQCDQGNLITKEMPEVFHRTDIPVRTDKLVITQQKKLKPLLYGEQGGHCTICKTHFLMQSMHIDHIVADEVGGSDDDSNKQLLCVRCNTMKGKRSQAWAIDYYNKHYKPKRQ